MLLQDTFITSMIPKKIMISLQKRKWMISISWACNLLFVVELGYIITGNHIQNLRHQLCYSIPILKHIIITCLIASNQLTEADSILEAWKQVSKYFWKFCQYNLSLIIDHGKIAVALISERNSATLGMLGVLQYIQLQDIMCKLLYWCPYIWMHFRNRVYSYTFAFIKEIPYRNTKLKSWQFDPMIVQLLNKNIVFRSSS